MAIAPVVNPQMKLTCNGEKIWAIASPTNLTCRLSLISGEDEDSVHCPQVYITQETPIGKSHGSVGVVRCDKNMWEFTYRVVTYGLFPEKIELFVAHPALRAMHIYTIDAVDETKGLFSVERGYLVRRVRFVFEDGLQSTGGGFLPSSPPVLSRRSSKLIRFCCTQDGKRYAFPNIPYIVLTPESYKENINRIPGIRIANSYLVPVAEKETGLYEMPICAQILPPDIYGIEIRDSNHELGHTAIRILSDKEVKIFNRQKHELKAMLSEVFNEKDEKE